MKNRRLEMRRYYGVISGNVEVKQVVCVVSGSIFLEPPLTTPYTQVVEKVKTHFLRDAEDVQSATQQFRNHMSALNSYLAFCGKTIASNVGSEFASQFETKLPAYAKDLDAAPRTRKDRVTQLKNIKRISELDVPVAASGNIDSLAQQLRRHIAATGVAPKTLAKQAGVDPTTLYRWIAGATPRPDTFPALRRLESHLGLARDTLVVLVKDYRGVASPPIPQPRFRTRIVALKNSSLAISYDELTPSFIAEWRAFFEYKTANFPSLDRHEKGRWRLIHKSVCTPLVKHAMRGEMACPTAMIAIEKIRSFLGVVTRLTGEHGGMVWSTIPSQTLALLAHPSALECYLQWMSSRSDGLRHEGHRVFAQLCASLLRPKTGYLWQQPALFRMRLPEDVRPSSDAEWQLMCEKSHKFLRNYIRTATDTSRHPEEAIYNILSLDEPFRPVFDAIQRIQADAAECLPGGRAQALLKRDALLLGLLISNPLRMRSIASLTWLPNNQGSIRRGSDGSWRIVLTPAQLKNGVSKVGRAYDVKVAAWVKPLLEDYLEEFRDTLLAGTDSNYLFVSSKKTGIWSGITSRVLKLTRRYIQASPGFGPHAFRHLVATAWLRAHPDDYLTVAELLNDSLTTVLKQYAHLRRDDSFGRFEAKMGPHA